MSTYIFNWSFDVETASLYIGCATQKDMDEFIYPTNIENIHIAGDHIDHLIIPEGVLRVTCVPVGLKTIQLPESIILLYCNNNLLKCLNLPSGIETVIAKRNLIEKVIFRSEPTNLAILKLCDNTRLSHLDFTPPESFEVLKLKRCNGLYKNLRPALLDIAANSLGKRQYIFSPVTI